MVACLVIKISHPAASLLLIRIPYKHLPPDGRRVGIVDGRKLEDNVAYNRDYAVVGSWR
jgi:hypothetical protein